MMIYDGVIRQVVAQTVVLVSELQYSNVLTSTSISDNKVTLNSLHEENCVLSCWLMLCTFKIEDTN